MRETINRIQITRDLLDKTQSGEIRWKIELDKSSSYSILFRHSKKITKLKSIVFIVTAKENINNSDLTILFGLKGKESLVSLITMQSTPLLYQLIEELVWRNKNGEIQPLKENMSFGGGNKDEGSDKMKNLKLINMLVKNTEDGKLAWEDTYTDDKVTIFLSNFQITKLKSLTFIARTSSVSEDKDDNVLRVTLKNKKKPSDLQGDVKLIRGLRLKDYPTLYELFKLLNARYLEREWVSPHNKNKQKSPSVVVTVDNFEDYKLYILEVIKDLIRSLPTTRNFEYASEELWELYQRCKISKDYDEANNILFRAKSLMDSPMGSHMWM